MIPQPLISRLETNLKKLAEMMPEKFELRDEENIAFPEYKTLRMFEETTIFIHLFAVNCFVERDCKDEFSNSIGRIFWEAWEERLELMIEIFHSGRIVYKFHCEELQSTEELSAQIEALCIRIERM